MVVGFEEVVGDVGFGVESETEPSGIVIVCVLLQSLSSTAVKTALLSQGLL